jgi:hypothetical protein
MPVLQCELAEPDALDRTLNTVPKVLPVRLAALRGGILNTIDLFMTPSLWPLAPVILGAIVVAACLLLMRMAKLALIRFHRMAGSALIWSTRRPGVRSWLACRPRHF